MTVSPTRENPASMQRCRSRLLAAILLASWLGGGLSPGTATPAGAAPGQEPVPTSDPAGTTRAEKTEEPTAREKREGKRKKPRRKEIEAAIEALPPQFRTWLQEVDLLISDEEVVAFLEIDKDYQRDAFIERFWKVRDPFPSSGRNEFRDRWYDRLDEARAMFGSLEDERARYILLNGPPMVRIPFTCGTAVHPLEVWFYRASEKVGYEFFLVFVRRYGRPDYTLFRAGDSLDSLFNFYGAGSGASNLEEVMRDVYTCRDGEIVVAALSRILNRPMEYEMLLAKIESPRETPSGEWLATFSAYSTDLPEAAETMPGELTLAYPSRIQARTVVAGAVQIPKESATVSELAESRTYNFFLTGEVLLGDALFENFRYRYDFPAEQVEGAASIPLLFQRRLRPGTYRLVVKVDDLNSNRIYREEREIEVPFVESAVADLPDDPETRRVLEEAAKAIGNELPTVEIVPPHGTMQTGMLRFDTLVTGEEVAEVRFALDTGATMTKRRPPYSIELDLGSVPRTHRLRVTSHDEAGNELASDELTVNAGRNTFEVRFIEPTSKAQLGGSADVRLDVKTPEGSFVERVELFLNEELVATLYQPPFAHTVKLPAGDQLVYLQAVAYLPDGNSTFDQVFVNAPDYLENVDIQYVELFTSALDKQGRPVLGLTEADFAVNEDGVPQEIRRFEQVDDLPLHVEVMLDVSASMEADLEGTQQAALRFFESTLTPKDRAALITFNDHPYLAVDFTNEIKPLAGGLAGLDAERGTSLYDAIIFGLYYLNGIKGQRAILLLSDGKDESSRFSFEDTLEYARRAGVAIYSIGLDLDGKGSGLAKKKLEELSEETGGRASFIRSTDELAAIYDQIQRELRSRYLITYQSSNSTPSRDFRTIAVTSSAPGVQVKTLSGYYP
ncbi:MAG TPA: VWA domain-containing protein [Thermoanaerobaculia bacterium]|nr:VWA domain-containing protein [Thermoanaerobaculia bacterium]